MAARFLLACVFLGMIAGLFQVFGQTKEPDKKKPVDPKEPTVRIVRLTGDIDIAAETLRKIYKAKKFASVEISVLPEIGCLMISAPADLMEEVLSILDYLSPWPSTEKTTELIHLESFNGPRLEKTLKGMFGAKGPYLEADSDRNALIVHGTRYQIMEVKIALKDLKKTPGEDDNTCIFTLERSQADLLAEALAEVFRTSGRNPIRIEQPGKISNKSAHAASPGAGKPVTLTPMSYQLKVVCEDHEALAHVKELIRIFTRPQAGEDHVETIRLKYSRAEKVAKLLMELINENRSLADEKVADFQNAARPRSLRERIRIVPDQETNSLVIRAAPLDVVMIRKLLKNQLDAFESDSGPRRYWVYKFQNGDAENTAKVLRQFYPEGNEAVAIGVDVKTNSLIVSSSQDVWNKIETLLKDLERKKD